MSYSEDDLHRLADFIEHVQTRWHADRDDLIEPLAEYTARALLNEGCGTVDSEMNAFVMSDPQRRNGE